jgi:hypothetical protein
VRRRRAIFGGMPRIRLDSNTADRILSGDVDPRDVPPGYERVALLLRALGEERANPAPAPRHKEPTPMLAAAPARWKISSLAIAAACCLGTGTAAYASGLPQSASDTASAILAKLGVQSHSSRSHPANHGADVSAVARNHSLTGKAHGAAVSAVAGGNGQAHRHGGKPDGSDEGSESGAPSGKGSTISSLARSTKATGADKGAAISTAASGGRSQAGHHENATSPTTADADAHAAQGAHSGGRPGGSSTTAH